MDHRVKPVLMMEKVVTMEKVSSSPRRRVGYAALRPPYVPSSL